MKLIATLTGRDRRNTNQPAEDMELRREAETTLGDAFDIRDFHDELLGAGALPLDVLETGWISGSHPS